MSNQPNHPNWWQTIGGLLTGAATMITALTGVGVFLYQMGIIDIPKSGAQSRSSQSGIVEPVKPSPARRPEQPSGGVIKSDT